MTPTAPGATLIAAMQRTASGRGYTLDPFQLAAIDRLGRMADELLVPPRRDTPRSLYLWGPVGRGKSFLLDGFFDAMPLAQKRRVHFHAFFRELHQRMFEHADSGNAMEAALEQMLGDCRLLCFDEFHLHDIGDAMLISRLFKAIFARGVVLLTTSNYPPDGLLPNPLYHERFLPTIELIEQRMDILSIAGEVDYRGLESAEPDPFHQGAYLCPGNEAQREALGLPRRPTGGQDLQVGHRLLRVLSVDGQTLQFSFKHLCEGPTATMDYLALVAEHDRWILEDLPRLSSASPAAQQRFINLIDVLYDRRCQLFLISALPLQEALNSAEVADISRTRSRLSQLRQIPVIEDSLTTSDM
ncbi:cell division protein ZapE [Pseudomonas mangiferae]|uniref:Cell division protein ZapE n=1 Tax=Pseudomonas mangiferae TaxID=2593654 RepID=A0A553H372_9PSED|nr:cell division protein ZapE [Pseudomonas mangiferae]TRX76185.1 cell division protein ZapE [Pseudomonas mangiferae]